MANMHKKQRRQDRDGLVMMARSCSDIADTPTSPILLQRSPSTILQRMCVYYARCTQLASHKLCIGSVMNMLNRDLGTGELCDNIGLVGVSAKWSYVTASPSHHDQAIPILSPLLFMHVGHPYIPLFKIR